MSPFRRRQFLGWAILGVAALLGLAWLARLDYTQKISTDVLDLIPASERSPELALVRELAGEAEARVMFFVLTGADGLPVSGEATQRFAAELARSPAFAQALPLADAASRDALGRELFTQRFTLLFPIWLRDREAAFAATGGDPARFAGWLAEDTAAALGRFLNAPEALALQDTLPSDPLLLMSGVLTRLKGSLALVQPAAETKTSPPALVWARIAASPLREEGQAPVFAAIAEATAKVRADFPGLVVADTGVNRFAAASRVRIEREVSWLNALSLAAVLAVALTFIRGAHRGLHLVPVVLCSILGAWVAATLTFDRLHILVFVVGSLLTGVAIDYGFYLYMQPPLVPGEDYWLKVRRLMKPLLASCFTTVAGFALLTGSELPLIRQLGVFVGAGLICALGAAIVYFSTVKNPFLETRSFRGGQALSEGTRRGLRRALVIVWCLSLPGLFLLQWRDDIRELEIPAVALKREDARIRALFGDNGRHAIYLTHGNSVTEARAALEKFDAWLRTAGGAAQFSISLSAIVPTAAEHARAVKFVHEQSAFPDRLRAALNTAGFEAEGFAPFFEAYTRHASTAAETDFEPAIRALHTQLGGPLGLLLHLGRPLTWFVTIADHAPAAPPPSELHTASASQLQSLNQIFGRYRQSALHLSLIGLAIVGLGVFLTYGLRDGVRIFAIPCGACLGLFGVLGWLGQPLNLFHLLGAFLGVCLTHNYSIFSVTSAYEHEPPPVSVRLSALCTAASFGVLALSGIPVVRALGSTVAMMVLAALLVIEFEHFGFIKKRS
jgi:predicted exporter